VFEICKADGPILPTETKPATTAPTTTTLQTTATTTSLALSTKPILGLLSLIVSAAIC
jgi:hypothetical protein